MPSPAPRGSWSRNPVDGCQKETTAETEGGRRMTVAQVAETSRWLQEHWAEQKRRSGNKTIGKGD